jgi:methionine-rich copper-binding protein CopC
MMSRGLVRPALAVLCLLMFVPVVAARPMKMMESNPAAGTAVEGRNAQYFVRFDGPVDHRNSRLWITQGSRVVATLHPSLDAAPEVLFASNPRLPQGDYELHWGVRSMPDGDVTEGSVPFAVKPP